MNEINGYVVRGKNIRGERVWAMVDDGVVSIVPRRAEASTCDIAEATQTWADMCSSCEEPRIFAVHADGTETPLPTYEEALASREVERQTWARLVKAAETDGGEFDYADAKLALRDLGVDVDALLGDG